MVVSCPVRDLLLAIRAERKAIDTHMEHEARSYVELARKAELQKESGALFEGMDTDGQVKKTPS
jgi:hypothetical protein